MLELNIKQKRLSGGDKRHPLGDLSKWVFCVENCFYMVKQDGKGKKYITMALIPDGVFYPKALRWKEYSKTKIDASDFKKRRYELIGWTYVDLDYCDTFEQAKETIINHFKKYWGETYTKNLQRL